MSNARLFTNTVIMLAATTTLSVAACEKPPSTPPDEGATPAGDDDDDDVVAAPADEDDDEVEAAEPLTKASFDETVHEHFGEVSDCYVAALEGDPKLQGKLNAEFTIGEDGQVLGITAADDSTLTDEGLLACINQAAANWTFARPPQGEMTLRYLYDLAPSS
ncbi:MAG: AgmX/PglI C-terminal domain-containing protein [Enhygromyxa sp.]